LIDLRLFGMVIHILCDREPTIVIYVGFTSELSLTSVYLAVSGSDTRVHPQNPPDFIG